jgi:phosphoglycerate dehydrogenase-like enzyme
MAGPTLTLGVFNERSGWRLPEPLVRRIEADGRVRVLQPSTRSQLIDAMAETDYLFGLPLSTDQLRTHHGQVQWIQLTHSSGDATVALRTALELGVRVTTAAHVRATQIAEHVLALSLALARGLHHSFDLQAEHRWDPQAVAARIGSLRGATVALVSVGAIAEAIAQRLKAFGCHVAAHLPAGDPAATCSSIDEVVPTSRLRELLGRCDVAIVAVTRVPSTEALIGRKELRQLRDGAFLVSVSRGGVIEETALLDALRSGRLGGAALDSFDTEPLPTNAAYWTMPNVLVTPHVAAASPHYWDLAVDVLLENLRRLRAGEPLLDEVAQESLDAQRDR